MENIVFAPAYALAEAIRHHRLSVVDVLEAYLTQIDHHNLRLNAIVTLDADHARQRAIAADAALRRGDLWGPLHGVPITLEDCHATTGLRSTWGGCPSLLTHTPAQDSIVTARLRAAGAIIVGKTNGPTVWPESPFGATRNPWDHARSAGGSSSGPAAAVAAGLSAVDIGADTLGSILNPCVGYQHHPLPLRLVARDYAASRYS